MRADALGLHVYNAVGWLYFLNSGCSARLVYLGQFFQQCKQRSSILIFHSLYRYRFAQMECPDNGRILNGNIWKIAMQKCVMWHSMRIGNSFSLAFRPLLRIPNSRWVNWMNKRLYLFHFVSAIALLSSWRSIDPRVSGGTAHGARFAICTCSPGHVAAASEMLWRGQRWESKTEEAALTQRP